jgi:hypothetical protein
MPPISSPTTKRPKLLIPLRRSHTAEYLITVSLLARPEREGKVDVGMSYCGSSGTSEVLVVDHLNAAFWHHDVRKVILLLEKPDMRVA